VAVVWSGTAAVDGPLIDALGETAGAVAAAGATGENGTAEAIGARCDALGDVLDRAGHSGFGRSATAIVETLAAETPAADGIDEADAPDPPPLGGR
jgi:hypothetical protein